MPSVLVAPDSVTGTLTAAEVAAHVAAGLRRARPHLDESGTLAGCLERPGPLLERVGVRIAGEQLG